MWGQGKCVKNPFLLLLFYFRLRTSAIIFIAFISLSLFEKNFYYRLPLATFHFDGGEVVLRVRCSVVERWVGRSVGRSVGLTRRHLNYENLSRLAGAVFIDRAWKTLLPFALSASKHCPAVAGKCCIKGGVLGLRLSAEDWV